MSSLVKATKKVAKGFGKAVKKVARGIGDLGKKVVSGFGKVYAKTFGKLGPLGAIAASFILPGIGGMIGGMWTNAAGFLGQQGAFLGAVGKGMTAISSGLSTAQGFAGNLFSSVSDKVSGVLTNLGGSIKNGANALFKGAQEFVGVKNPASIQDIGKWVSDKAQSFAGKTQPESLGGVQASPAQLQPSLFDAKPGPFEPLQPELGGPFSPAAAQTTPLQETIALSDTSIAGNVALSEGFTGGVDQITENLSRQAASGQSFMPEASLAEGASRALAKTLLAGGPSQEVGALPFISTLPGQQDLGTASRGLVGATGAGGGQFLTPQQKAFFEEERRRLGVIA
jgi:hypothetical protein